MLSKTAKYWDDDIIIGTEQRKKFKKLIGIKINTYIGQVNRV